MNDVPRYGKAKTIDFKDIPIIDVQEIETADGKARIGAEIVKAAETVGFFYLSGHGIAPSLIERAFATSKMFFELPEHEKFSITVDQNQRSWMAQGLARLEGSKTHDAKEVFFWGWDIGPDDADLNAGVAMVAQNQWPDHVAPLFRTDLMPYYLAVVALGRSVMQAIALGLGKNVDFFDAGYNVPLARGQLVYYPKPNVSDHTEERFGAAAHSDFGALTTLMQDNNGGLQVQNKAGDWIAAPPIDGTFVCNIGDLLEQWTNGRLVSTKHRVLNMSKHDRYSIPIFFDPNSKTIIDPADFACDAPLAYEAKTAGEHIMARNKKNFGQYSKSK